MNAGGGGATHISYISGMLSELSTHQSDNQILIVAGGGGGGRDQQNASEISAHADGGSGGGFSGGYPYGKALRGWAWGYMTAVVPGNQTTGYAFGLGQSASGNSASGAGWYGGKNGGASTIEYTTYAGSGGSGYIANDNLKNKKMVCYDCPQDLVNEKTYTISNTCHNSSATTDCAKENNGYARITYIAD